MQNFNSLFIIEKHILMKRMSEEKAVASLLNIPLDVVNAMMKDHTDMYRLILDDIVPDEDIIYMLRKGSYFNPRNFFNYKHFYLSNERIAALANDLDKTLDPELVKAAKENTLVTEYNTEIENEIQQYYIELRQMYEQKIVTIDNCIRLLFPDDLKVD